MYKIIKTKEQYESALSEVRELMSSQPEKGSEEFERLELMALLIKNYEDKELRKPSPDPIEAIKFRMEQENLSRRDLEPIIGSRSKVSEVLSGKRPLTVGMMQALHETLDIPASVLLSKNATNEADDQRQFDWDRFPLKEMIRRKWLQISKEGDRDAAVRVLQEFVRPIQNAEPATFLYKTTQHLRTGRRMDPYALVAWTARVVRVADANRPTGRFDGKELTMDFMRSLVRLSISNDGPLLARQALSNSGIALVVESHLPRTHLDGAAINLLDEYPIVALTIRYDRIDNFWFTLMHELAHVALHRNVDVAQFYDDLDIAPEGDILEEEADSYAAETLIPHDEWVSSAASRLRSPASAEHLAAKLEISPAIVAGRMRHEFKAFRLLNSLVGHKEVRKLFTEVEWKK